jgi:hypothetical protein
MFLVGKINFSEVYMNDTYKVKCHEIKQEDKCKVPVLKELTNVKFNILDLEGVSLGFLLFHQQYMELSIHCM